MHAVQRVVLPALAHFAEKKQEVDLFIVVTDEEENTPAGGGWPDQGAASAQGPGGAGLAPEPALRRRARAPKI